MIFFDENEGKKNEIIKFQREWKEPFEKKSNQMTSGETWIKVRKTAGRLTETVESRQLRWRKYKSFSLKHCRLTFYTRNKKKISSMLETFWKNSIPFNSTIRGQARVRSVREMPARRDKSATDWDRQKWPNFRALVPRAKNEREKKMKSRNKKKRQEK